MPWKVCYRMSIVFALSCGRTKKIQVSYIWTRIFRKKAKKTLRFQKYPDTCGRDPAVKSLLFDRNALLCLGVYKFSWEEAPPPPSCRSLTSHTPLLNKKVPFSSIEYGTYFFYLQKCYFWYITERLCLNCSLFLLINSNASLWETWKVLCHEINKPQTVKAACNIKITAQNIPKGIQITQQIQKKKIETNCNCGSWKLVSLAVFQRSFLLLFMFDIMLWERYLYDTKLWFCYLKVNTVKFRK